RNDLGSARRLAVHDHGYRKRIRLVVRRNLFNRLGNIPSLRRQNHLAGLEKKRSRFERGRHQPARISAQIEDKPLEVAPAEFFDTVVYLTPGLLFEAGDLYI